MTVINPTKLFNKAADGLEAMKTIADDYQAASVLTVRALASVIDRLTAEASVALSAYETLQAALPQSTIDGLIGARVQPVPAGTATLGADINVLVQAIVSEYSAIFSGTSIAWDGAAHTEIVVSSRANLDAAFDALSVALNSVVITD